jgi:peptide/nickel transport system permease protein
MIKLLLRRLAAAIVMLFVVSTVTFLLVRLDPADPANSFLGGFASASQRAAIDHKLGIDRPILIQYKDWMGNALRGNLGRSLMSDQPVEQAIGQALPTTISLAIGATLIAFVIGIGIGLVSALRGGMVDSVVQGVGVFLGAIPNYWLAVFLVAFLAVQYGLFPATGYVPITSSFGSWLSHIALPVIALAVGGIAVIARQTRGALLDVLGRDYVRTLRAAGLPRRSIVLKHGLRNAAIPIVTNVGILFIGSLSGAFLIEQFFALPGLGRLTLTAISQHDYTLIQGVVVYTTAIVLLVTLVMDLTYGWLNPKARQS